MAAYISISFLPLQTLRSTFMNKHKQLIYIHLLYQIYPFSSIDIVLAVKEATYTEKKPCLQTVFVVAAYHHCR